MLAREVERCASVNRVRFCSAPLYDPGPIFRGVMLLEPPKLTGAKRLVELRMFAPESRWLG